MTHEPLPLSKEGLSTLTVALDVPESAGWEDVTNPDLPGSPTIRPKHLMLFLYPATETDDWEVFTAKIIGPKVRASTGSLTKRNYEIPFMRPLDEDATAPDRVRAEARRWQARVNGTANLTE